MRRLTLPARFFVLWPELLLCQPTGYMDRYGDSDSTPVMCSESLSVRTSNELSHSKVRSSKPCDDSLFVKETAKCSKQLNAANS